MEGEDFYFGVVSRRLSKRVNDWNFERLAIMIIDDDWIKFCVTIYPLIIVVSTTATSCIENESERCCLKGNWPLKKELSRK
jgi:hypothetical protein